VSLDEFIHPLVAVDFAASLSISKRMMLLFSLILERIEDDRPELKRLATRFS
jgi:hypothetical protein